MADAHLRAEVQAAEAAAARAFEPEPEPEPEPALLPPPAPSKPVAVDEPAPPTVSWRAPGLPTPGASANGTEHDPSTNGTTPHAGEPTFEPAAAEPMPGQKRKRRLFGRAR